MREINFTDISGKQHKLKVKPWYDSKIKVPEGFTHYMTIDEPFNVCDKNIKTQIVGIGDFILNEVTGELKAKASNQTGYQTIGTLTNPEKDSDVQNTSSTDVVD